MSVEHDGNKLEQSLKKAGSQWREDDLDEIMALLEKDYTQPEQRRSLEKVQSLLQEDSPVEMFGCGPILMDDEAAHAEPEQAQEEALSVPPAPGMAVPEQADFTDTPVKQRKPRTALTLALVGVVEAVALVAVAFWWLRWLK